MPIKIRHITKPAELIAVYRQRYTVYVEELKISAAIRGSRGTNGCRTARLLWTYSWCVRRGSASWLDTDQLRQ